MLLNYGVGEDSENPLDCKEIQPVHPKGNQSWVFTGRTDVEAEIPIFWPPEAKSWLIWKDPDVGKDWRQDKKRMTKDEMVGWHHWLDGHEFEETLGAGDGQGSLVCCSGVTKSWTGLSNGTKLYLHRCTSFSLFVVIGSYSLVALCGLLIAVAFLVVERRL